MTPTTKPDTALIGPDSQCHSGREMCEGNNTVVSFLLLYTPPIWVRKIEVSVEKQLTAFEGEIYHFIFLSRNYSVDIKREMYICLWLIQSLFKFVSYGEQHYKLHNIVDITICQEKDLGRILSRVKPSENDFP